MNKTGTDVINEARVLLNSPGTNDTTLKTQAVLLLQKFVLGHDAGLFTIVNSMTLKPMPGGMHYGDNCNQCGIWVGQGDKGYIRFGKVKNILYCPSCGNKVAERCGQGAAFQIEVTER